MHLKPVIYNKNKKEKWILLKCDIIVTKWHWIVTEWSLKCTCHWVDWMLNERLLNAAFQFSRNGEISSCAFWTFLLLRWLLSYEWLVSFLCMYVCLFFLVYLFVVCGFSSYSTIFHLYWNVTFTCEDLKNLHRYFSFMSIGYWRFFSMPRLLGQHMLPTIELLSSRFLLKRPGAIAAGIQSPNLTHVTRTL